MTERVIQITDIMGDSGLDGPNGTVVQVFQRLNSILLESMHLIVSVFVDISR